MLPFGFRMSITQVLRDGHKELPSGCLSGEERSAMCDKRRSEVQQFMQTKAEASQVEASGNPKKEAELVRLANTHYLCALDNAMRGGIGQGLARFCCLRRPVALGPHQRRYFISSEEAGMAPGGAEHSCIIDDSTGKRWLECPAARLPSGERDRPKLVLAADRGLVGFPAVRYLLEQTPVRGSSSGTLGT